MTVLRTIVAVATTAILMSTQSAVAAELEQGIVLDQQNWTLAEGLLPPEILRHYREGDYANKIVAWPEGSYRWPDDFADATNANEGRFAIGENGQIIENATGQQPLYVLGFPFPKIDKDDPQAGIKVVWNYFYGTWYFGNIRVQSQLNWVNPRRLERRSDNDVMFQFYDGIPAKDRIDNPNNLLMQYLTVVEAPADLAGTAALAWRYRDTDKRDTAWSFVPALRRVRAVSPSNRSDGFLGSDMSQDDGPFFDGKPEDFTWTLREEVEELRYVDEINLRGEAQSIWVDGAWRSNWPDGAKTIGYMDDDWNGVAWAPISAAMAKRRFYVVDGIPKDKYYLYGRLELHIDTITFQGAWNRKFGWKGKLLNTLQVMAFNPVKVTNPEGESTYIRGTNMQYQCAESLVHNRATIAGLKTSPNSRFDSRVKYNPSMFDMTALSRFGK